VRLPPPLAGVHALYVRFNTSMAAIEEIRIPLVWDPPPVTCRFVRWLVRDGEHVCPFQSIYELEYGDKTFEVESFVAGFMKQLCEGGSNCKVGDLIAKVVLDEINPSFRALPLYLSGPEIADLDAMRGDTPREIFIRDTMLGHIATNKNKSEQAAPSNP
jgi:pyruvate/2-oxoglutarate dehydrogenase complex dihydrolipoamide acyltransferase (E2) component